MKIRFVGIDPSTKTGFVALDEKGKVQVAKEITGIGKHDPKRMITLIDSLVRHLQANDFIVIENFGFATQQGIMLGGFGWGIRMALVRYGLQYIEVAPGQLKKFATGNGRTKKEEMIEPIEKEWGFTHKSDNVLDAYVLAQIGRSIYLKQVRHDYQKEVIDKVLENEQNVRTFKK